MTQARAVCREGLALCDTCTCWHRHLPDPTLGRERNQRLPLLPFSTQPQDLLLWDGFSIVVPGEGLGAPQKQQRGMRVAMPAPRAGGARNGCEPGLLIKVKATCSETLFPVPLCWVPAHEGFQGGNWGFSGGDFFCARGSPEEVLSDTELPRQKTLPSI